MGDEWWMMIFFHPYKALISWKENQLEDGYIIKLLILGKLDALFYCVCDGHLLKKLGRENLQEFHNLLQLFLNTLHYSLTLCLIRVKMEMIEKG